MDPVERPLHRAVMSGDMELAKQLLKDGIDVYSVNDEGMTPFHILIRNRIQIFSKLEGYQKYCSISQKPLALILNKNFKSTDGDDLWLIKFHNLEENEKLISLLMKYVSNDLNSTNDQLLIRFHAACTVNDITLVERLLKKINNVNQPIAENHSMWPGYTALHFAAKCLNIELMKLLVEKGAYLLASDAVGVTPLDICIESFNVEEVHSILTCVTAWRNIPFSDGKTNLMDYIFFLSESDESLNYLQTVGTVASDSPLWPGYTTLHLAVHLLPEKKIGRVHQILISADVTVRDKHGSTPLHLAFRLGKMKFVDALLEGHYKPVNPVDNDNLSYLHVACAVNNIKKVRKLIDVGEDINIAYNGRELPKLKTGWTAMSTACFHGHAAVVIMLRRAGARLAPIDCTGINEISPLPGTSKRMRRS